MLVFVLSLLSAAAAVGRAAGGFRCVVGLLLLLYYGGCIVVAVSMLLSRCFLVVVCIVQWLCLRASWRNGEDQLQPHSHLLGPFGHFGQSKCPTKSPNKCPKCPNGPKCLNAVGISFGE